MEKKDWNMTREEELSSRGWNKQTTYDEPRLAELIQVYQESGFEVHLEPFDPRDDSICSECMKTSPERYRTIYTRKPMSS